MEQVNYLIIGGGVAGTTCAETLREHDEKSRIVIVSNEPHPLYSRVLLTKPNFFMEKIPFEKIWLKDKHWYEKNRIELISGKTAVRLDPVLKNVALDDGSQWHYDKLLLAIGGKVRKLETPGADKEGVYYLRTVDDTRQIISAVKNAEHGVVLGGGIIGFEMAEMLQMAGLKTSYIIRMEHYREPFLGMECSLMIEDRIKKHGVEVFCENEIVTINGNNHIGSVTLKDGKELPCDILIVGIGCVTPSEWLREAGVEVQKGIVTNEYLETSIQDIWSAGDGTEFYDVIIGEKVIYGSWANAQKQGERAALNMLGQHEPFKAVTFFQTHGFGVIMTYVGDVRPADDREIIQRGHKGDDIQERLFLKNNKLVGVLLINAPQHMGAYSKIIENQIDLSGVKSKLSDPHYDIEKLLAGNSSHQETITKQIPITKD